VESKYSDHPFHNFHHGFAVLHFTYLMLMPDKGGGAGYLSSVHVFAGTVACALCVVGLPILRARVRRYCSMRTVCSRITYPPCMSSQVL
jgi:hypothetical protein